jgi:predicted DNA-binding transcriptional regulator YafY
MDQANLETNPLISFYPIKVRLRVPLKVKESLDQFPLAEDQKISPEKEYFIAEFTLQITQDLIHWIYSLGSDVVVLAPTQLREFVRNEISSTLHEYRLV